MRLNAARSPKSKGAPYLSQFASRTAQRAGNPLDRLRWTLCRLRFVCDSLDQVARAYGLGRGTLSPTAPLATLEWPCPRRRLLLPVHGLRPPLSSLLLARAGLTRRLRLDAWPRASRGPPSGPSAIAQPLRAYGLLTLHGLALPAVPQPCCRGFVPRHLSSPPLSQQ